MDTSFEHTLLMAKPLIGEYLKIDKSHGGPLDHWVGGLIQITIQTRYDIQYITMRLSDYMNAPEEHAFIAFKHGMKYIIHHPHEPIMYSRKIIHRTDKTPHQCYFKEGYS